MARLIGDEYVFCPEDRSAWEIVGMKATRGCCITGGGYDGYIVEEVRIYAVHRTFGGSRVEVYFPFIQEIRQKEYLDSYRTTLDPSVRFRWDQQICWFLHWVVL